MTHKQQQSDKLNRSITISLCLHVIVGILLVWGSTMTVIKVNDGGGAIDAVMVDLGSTPKQNNIQTDKPTSDKQPVPEKSKPSTSQKETDQSKPIEKPKPVVDTKAEKAAKEAAEVKAKEIAKQKEAADAKAKEIAKQKEAADAKAKEIAKQKEAADAKAKEIAEQKAEQAQQTTPNQDVNDLINSIASTPGSTTATKTTGQSAGSSGGSGGGATKAQVDEYTAQIKSAIQMRLNNYELYKGKECDLKISLARDGGRLINATVIGGDATLCQLALSAALEANIPKPPSVAVYNELKNAELNFKP